MTSALKTVLLALLLAAVFCGTSSNEDNVPNTPDRNAHRIIVSSNLNFTRNLYQVLSRKPGNIFFSPLSIQTIMSLAAQGARGSTLHQMIEGLNLPHDQQTTKDGFRQLLKVLKENDGEFLKIANKIYTDRRFPPKNEFLEIAQTSFQSDGEKVDFLRETEQARQKINKWVEQNTGNKIKNLVAEGTLSRNTVMALVNAMYFKGTWKIQFDPNLTKPGTFAVKPGVNQDVPMMHVVVEDGFHYREDLELNAKILEMFYVGSSISLVIILPNQKFGLREVESKLGETDLRNLFTRMEAPEIHLKMPKFKMEQTIELKDTLEQLGMGEIFTPIADFSGLSNHSISVSNVVHKGAIEINEQGAEAAVATVAHTVLLSALPDEHVVIHFNVDHPCVFMLRHARTEAVLFMGRLERPV